ncbi:hypothetical protein P0W64_21030 [Tsukamurella sp. 8F]|uniref:hypothetical protein n=1 Tax=unclassified Tsukamurella TaxID=2633480 RepID=UPI0023B8DB11|nr:MULTISPECIES: hypothetical protein [unclassified Tsukamurella]MDF0531026.1 hypothetical protein [Tsukamurella sp. 8J]MDF0589269.1 hypothetical protein [Tsukamurella sp. 8F]
MSDDYGPGLRPTGRGRARFQKLASAALNADVTIDQATAVVNDLSDTIRGMDSTMEAFDETLVRINRDLGDFEQLMAAIAQTTARVNAALDNVDKLLSAPAALGTAAASVLHPASDIANSAAGTVGRLLHLRTADRPTVD